MYLLTAMGLTAEATKEDPKTLQQVTTVYNGGPLCLGTNALSLKPCTTAHGKDECESPRTWRAVQGVFSLVGFSGTKCGWWRLLK